MVKKLELPLTRLHNGESGVVIAINPSTRNQPVQDVGRKRGRGFRKRLEDMGLTPGTTITVVKSAPFKGPVELHVRGSKLAIGRGMARKILVRVER